MERKEVRLEDLSDIRHRMFLHDYPHSDVKLLVIEFAGRHGLGSEGNDDSLFMETVIKAAMNVWHVDGLVLDFRQLNYEWGNSIGDVLLAGKHVRGRKFPTAVVVSDLCEPALRTAEPFYAMEIEGGGRLQWLFSDLHSALSFVSHK